MSFQINLIYHNAKLQGYLEDIRFFEIVILKNVFIKQIHPKSFEDLQIIPAIIYYV